MTQVGQLSTCEWKPLGVVEEGGALSVNGSNIWSGKWMALDAHPVGLEHPDFAGQTHTFRRYRFENNAMSFDFAAAELSPNVWGFYVLAQFIG
jgi:hypothetical protein